ncbi:NAD-dependent epimerase/dehydratase family protein, partial [Chloroflexota bacterium]
MANCIITGGFGFVGRHLVRMLLDRGDNVMVFDMVGGSPFLADIKDDFAVKVGNLANWVHLSEAI